ncbi:oxygen-dependent choline dehydrogenase-like [Mercenaria mercenaria]|uniref:oxygen-dependent choline dehydrogenase-like n=1 Tax=Mercenaria mercenaria TaxID=6596 RepID=UPI00234F4191|nr:oxygen-dependent choline dehydrogenase-like [Mercenaria mercenaria]
MECKSLTALIVVVLAVGYTVFVNKNKPSLGESIVLDKIRDEYDYVIVGAGSAGSILASRLSEGANYSVLLLEAGEHFDYDQNMHIPVLTSQFVNSNLAWHYQSETEKEMFLGLKNQTSLLNRGRVLGGSSSINACIYARGSPFDFEEWEMKYRCNGWGYNDLLPYFKKAEDIQIPSLKTSDYHGTGGPIAVSASPFSQLSKYFIDAGKEMGYMETDYNGKSQTGFSRVQNTVRNGVRSSTGLEYLGKPGKRQNFDIATNSFVTKIQIKEKVATGVYFIKQGRKQFVKAKRDVIVSAGAFNSPQLLMLSGIGPKSHLQDLDIPLVQDLPVGDKFDDHINIIIPINQSISTKIKHREYGLWLSTHCLGLALYLRWLTL